MFLDYTTLDTGPLFATHLFDDGLILQNSFSFHLSYDLAYIDFGRPDLNSMTSPMDIAEIRMEEDFFWSAYNQGLGFGSLNETDTYSYPGDTMLYSITDTGTSAIIIASDYYEAVIDKIFTSAGILEYDLNGGMAYGPCYGEDGSTFKTFYL